MQTLTSPQDDTLNPAAKPKPSQPLQNLPNQPNQPPVSTAPGQPALPGVPAPPTVEARGDQPGGQTQKAGAPPTTAPMTPPPSFQSFLPGAQGFTANVQAGQDAFAPPPAPTPAPTGGATVPGAPGLSPPPGAVPLDLNPNTPPIGTAAPGASNYPGGDVPTNNLASAMLGNIANGDTTNDAARQGYGAQLYRDWLSAHPGDMQGANLAMGKAFEGGGYGNAAVAGGADLTPEKYTALAGQVAGLAKGAPAGSKEWMQQQAAFSASHPQGQSTPLGPQPMQNSGPTSGPTSLASLLQGGGGGVSTNTAGGSGVGPMQSYRNLATGTMMQGGQVPGMPKGTLGVGRDPSQGPAINPLILQANKDDAAYYAAHPDQAPDLTGRLSPQAAPSGGTPMQNSAQPLQQSGATPAGAGAQGLSVNPGSLSALLQGGANPAGAGTNASASPSGGVMAGLPSQAPAAFGLSPTTPDNALTNSTINAGPGTDRFAIAQQQLQNFQKSTDPMYQAANRDALRAAAAGGAIGSGQLQTSLGDLANQRNLQLETQGNDFLSNALQGSLSDAWNKIGLAQQQQGFQAGQQQNAFGQSMAQTQLADQLKNSAFGRALQQQLAGSSGDPTSTLMGLSGIFGNQATGAGNSLAQLIAGLQQRNTQQGGQGGGQNGTGGTDFMSFLQQLLNGSQSGGGGGGGNVGDVATMLKSLGIG